MSLPDKLVTVWAGVAQQSAKNEAGAPDRHHEGQVNSTPEFEKFIKGVLDAPDFIDLNAGNLVAHYLMLQRAFDDVKNGTHVRKAIMAEYSAQALTNLLEGMAEAQSKASLAKPEM